MVDREMRKSQEFKPPEDTTVEMNPLGSPGESEHVVELDHVDFVPNLDSKPDTPNAGPLSPVLSHQLFRTLNTSLCYCPRSTCFPASSHSHGVCASCLISVVFAELKGMTSSQQHEEKCSAYYRFIRCAVEIVGH